MYQLCATGASDPLSNEAGELCQMCVCVCVSQRFECVFRVCLTTQKAFRRPTRQALIFHPRKTIKLQAKDCVRA